MEAKNIAGGILKNAFNIDDLIKVKDKLCSEESMIDDILTVFFGVWDDHKSNDGNTYASIILQVAVNMKDATTEILFKKDKL